MGIGAKLGGVYKLKTCRGRRKSAKFPATSQERVAFLTEFLSKVRLGEQQDFPWLTGTALGGGQGVGVFSLM